MKNNLTKEIVISLVLIALAVLLLNPFHFLIPEIVVMCLLAIVFVLFAIFASFILREKIFDERDAQHRTIAGRNAFLAGAGVLMLGILIQEYMESVDPWLIIALIMMIVVKLCTRIWSDKNL